MVPLRLHLALAVGVAFLGAASARALNLEGRAHSLARDLGSLIPRPEEAPRQVPRLEGEFEPVFAASARPEPADPKAGREKRKRPRHHPAKVIRVDADTVLRLARLGRVPSGLLVEKTAARPAGLRVTGVGAYGVGLEDGDVLVEVNGVAVRSKGEVVAAVLAARVRREARMQARLYRGPEAIGLIVEMPYLDG